MNIKLVVPIVLSIGLSSTSVLSEVTHPTNLPHAPANQWEYPLIDSFVEQGKDKFKRPHIPPFRLSRDGRLGIRIHNRFNDSLSLFLLAPDKIEKPFMLSEPGVDILSSTTAQTISSEMLGTDGDRTNAYFLCENPETPNPRVCSDDSSKDCYDVTIVGRKRTETNGKKSRLYSLVGTKVTIEVSNPKTANATISDITVTPEPKEGVQRPYLHNEVSVTLDGKLLMTKVNAPWNWTSADGLNINYPEGSKLIAYSYNDSANVCDVDGWNKFHPLTHAYFDPELKDESGNAKYGFAEYQMRDPEGNYLDNGEEIMTDQYPWVDPKGDNVFMSLGVDMLFYRESNTTVKTRYPANCLTDACKLPVAVGEIKSFEATSNVNRNVSFFGRWSHGKLVTMDNLINYMDYGIYGANNKHLEVKLYEENTSGKKPNSDMSKFGKVVMAHNKFPEGSAPLGSVMEGAQLGSIDNRLNYLPNLKPKTPRDVVWFINKGNGGTTEFAFDDYLDPNVFIYSPMNQSMAVDKGADRDVTGGKNWHDGFDRPTRSTGNGFNSDANPLRLQNAATADANIPGANQFWNIPTYGAPYGNVRVEPYALGGIEGKGFWLDGQSGIEYTIPAQDKRSFTAGTQNWYFGLFLDYRHLSGASISEGQRLLTFPDGSSISLKNASNLSVNDGSGNNITTIKLPEALETESWKHLGFAVHFDNGSTVLDVYVNGFLSTSWTGEADQSVLVMKSGSLSVGEKNGNTGFTGWIDDFKVVARDLSAEEYCNHARGTIVGISNKRRANAWNSIAKNYPKASHKAIKKQLISNGYKTYRKYACYIDYHGTEMGANMAEIPRGTVSLRTELLNVKPLVFDLPRPGSENNSFCLSCHVTGGGQGLTPAALTFDSTKTMQLDHRRQPMQPRQKIYGNIPANYFGEGKPASPIKTAPEGVLIDQWLHPDEK